MIHAASKSTESPLLEKHSHAIPMGLPRRTSVYLTVTGPVFAAPSIGYEIEHEDVMLIRIRRHDNEWKETQAPEAEGIIAVSLAVPTARYTDQKPTLRILCGSI